MAVDHDVHADRGAENVKEPSPPPPDRQRVSDTPGAEGDGVPSRADSRAAANAANDHTNEQKSGDTPDPAQSPGRTGDGHGAGAVKSRTEQSTTTEPAESVGDNNDSAGERHKPHKTAADAIASDGAGAPETGQTSAAADVPKETGPQDDRTTPADRPGVADAERADRRPSPDTPGAEGDGVPSRADSRAAAAAANEQAKDKAEENTPGAAAKPSDGPGTEQAQKPEKDTPRPAVIEPATPTPDNVSADATEQPLPIATEHTSDGAARATVGEGHGEQRGDADPAALHIAATGDERADQQPGYADTTEDQKTTGAPGSPETGDTAEVIDPRTGDTLGTSESYSRIDTPDNAAGRAPLLDFRRDGQVDGERRAIPGDGLPDDNARVADRDDIAVERGIFGDLKRAVLPDRSDRPKELVGTVDRPDFQDLQANPRLVPDRYGTPLERADGTRTPLFDGEPTREQTRQGRLGDCGVIAALGAVAGHHPEAIRDCVRETGDGTYEVRFHEATYSASRMRYESTGRPITLTVTSDVPVYDAKPHRPAFADSTSTGAAWAPVLEKAIAGIDQTWTDERHQKWTDRWDIQGNGTDAPTGYVRLNQGSNPGDRAELLTQLTGQPAKTWDFPTGYNHNGRSADRQLIDEFRQQLADNKPILVGTRNLRKNEPPLVKDLQECHAYEVTKVDDKGRIHLRNPWNELHPEPLTIKEFKANIRPRYSTLE